MTCPQFREAAYVPIPLCTPSMAIAVLRHLEFCRCCRRWTTDLLKTESPPTMQERAQVHELLLASQQDPEA